MRLLIKDGLITIGIVWLLAIIAEYNFPQVLDLISSTGFQVLLIIAVLVLGVSLSKSLIDRYAKSIESKFNDFWWDRFSPLFMIGSSSAESHYLKLYIESIIRIADEETLKELEWYFLEELTDLEKYKLHIRDTHPNISKKFLLEITNRVYTKSQTIRKQAIAELGTELELIHK